MQPDLSILPCIASAVNYVCTLTSFGSGAQPQTQNSPMRQSYSTQAKPCCPPPSHKAHTAGARHLAHCMSQSIAHSPSACPDPHSPLQHTSADILHVSISILAILWVGQQYWHTLQDSHFILCDRAHWMGTLPCSGVSLVLWISVGVPCFTIGRTACRASLDGSAASCRPRFRCCHPMCCRPRRASFGRGMLHDEHSMLEGTGRRSC